MTAVPVAQGNSEIVTKKVLAFGGNGFIGSEVVHALIQSKTTKYEITLVSRGNWYFDSKTRIKPFIKKQIICDREESDIEFCTELMYYVKDTEFIDIVLDFSSYKPEVLQDTLNLVKGWKVGVYFYISSDSVYEVCKAIEGGRPAKEQDSIRPENDEERNELNDNDSYGDAKLAGEEVLTNPENDIPYVIFRLPDVIGPRDTTDRWWTYQMWIEFYNFIKEPIHIPEDSENLRTSYVYVKDVAQAVLLALEKGPKAWNNIYNLGLDRDFTLREFLHDLAHQLQTEVKYNVQGEFSLFPSVTRGSVNIDKAKTILGFVPSKWSDVLKDTVQFYNDAFIKFQSERDDVVHQITKYILPRDRKGGFLQVIDKLTEERQHGFQEGPKKTEL